MLYSQVSLYQCVVRMHQQVRKIFYFCAAFDDMLRAELGPTEFNRLRAGLRRLNSWRCGDKRRILPITTGDAAASDAVKDRAAMFEGSSSFPFLYVDESGKDNRQSLAVAGTGTGMELFRIFWANLRLFLQTWRLSMAHRLREFYSPAACLKKS